MEPELIVKGVSLIAVTGGLTWVAGQAGIPSKWLPLLSLVLGVATSALATWAITGDAILVGIVAGLMASGAYDNLAKGKQLVTGK